MTAAKFDLVNRRLYLNRALMFRDTDLIKVITGMRRSGKSVLMKAFSASVAQKGPSANNVFNSNRVPINHVTVGCYISSLRDAFVFYEAKRCDTKGKKCLSTQAKHYVCDSGMRYAVLGTRNMDWGRMYENAVFARMGNAVAI